MQHAREPTPLDIRILADSAGWNRNGRRKRNHRTPARAGAHSIGTLAPQAVATTGSGNRTTGRREGARRDIQAGSQCHDSRTERRDRRYRSRERTAPADDRNTGWNHRQLDEIRREAIRRIQGVVSWQEGGVSMNAIKQWFIDLLRTEKARKFNPDADRDIQRWRSIRQDLRDNRSQRRREAWHERNALERELLGDGGKR